MFMHISVLPTAVGPEITKRVSFCCAKEEEMIRRSAAKVINFTQEFDFGIFAGTVSEYILSRIVLAAGKNKQV